MKYFRYNPKLRYFMTRIKKKVEEKAVEEKVEEVVERDVEKPVEMKSRREQCYDRLRPIIAEETKLVRGRFRNYEDPGSIAPIFVKKYPGVPEFNKKMIDGQIYEIPLYVARFLNGVDVLAKGANQKINTCSTPVHSFILDSGQDPKRALDESQGAFKGAFIDVTARKRRYGFESMEFDTSAGSSFGASAA